jgi:hypothetical protein
MYMRRAIGPYERSVAALKAIAAGGTGCALMAGNSGLQRLKSRREHG